MIKKIIQTLFVSMLLLFAVPIGAFAINDTTTNTTINNSTTPVVVDTTNVTPVVNSTVAVDIVNATNVNISTNTTPIGTSVTTTTNVTNSTTIVVDTDSDIEDLNSELDEVESDSDNEIDEIEGDITSEMDEIENEMEEELDEIENEIPEGEEISEEDSTIIEDFDGAQMRLFQLQNRVDFQVEAAGMILGKITQLGKEAQFDMNALNTKVNELRAISISVAEFDSTGKNASQIAEEFVALKTEAITISKAFKTLIGDGLTAEDKAALKKLINKKNNDRKSIKDSRIEKLKNKFNKKQVIKIAKHFNTDPTLIAKYEAGEYTEEQVKNFIKKKFNKLSKEDRDKLKSKILENDVKHKINLKEDRKKFTRKAKELREEHRKSFENRKDEIKERFENQKELRKQRFEERKERFEDERELRKERFEDRKENLRERLEDKRENLRERFEDEKERFEDDDLVTLDPVNPRNLN